MKPIGRTVWVIPGGHIPLKSSGHEPEYTSRDVLCMLNTGDEDAEIRITIYYADREPAGPYPLKVAARRVRHVHFNDLIDPEAMPLDTDYGSIIESTVPIVIQFIRQDTSQAENALFSIIAYSGT
ncbi:MAG TPA: sensory rhodopsin transducer [Methanomicrobiales archaeon]|nr:sensory rhodopsin transducer [Methanomicrobiales archaeon]